MAILPKIKATISAFLLGEEGKISKQGVLVAATALASMAALSPLALGGCSGGCGGCCCGGCGCGCSCSFSCTVVPPPSHSSSTEIVFQPLDIEKGIHYSHSSV